MDGMRERTFSIQILTIREEALSQLGNFIMRPLNNRIFPFVFINLSTTTVFVFLMWFISKYFVKGLLNSVGYILFLPSFLMISLFRNVNVALHYTTRETFLLVSFIFYSLVIATAQWILYKRKKKREGINT